MRNVIKCSLLIDYLFQVSVGLLREAGRLDTAPNASRVFLPSVWVMIWLAGPGSGRDESRKSIDLGQPDLGLQDDIIDEVGPVRRVSSDLVLNSWCFTKRLTFNCLKSVPLFWGCVRVFSQLFLVLTLSCRRVRVVAIPLLSKLK